MNDRADDEESDESACPNLVALTKHLAQYRRIAEKLRDQPRHAAEYVEKLQQMTQRQEQLIRAAGEDWWAEITTYTERDQVSQPFAMRDEDLKTAGEKLVEFRLLMVDVFLVIRVVPVHEILVPGRLLPAALPVMLEPNRMLVALVLVFVVLQAPEPAVVAPAPGSVAVELVLQPVFRKEAEPPLDACGKGGHLIFAVSRMVAR